MFKLDNFHRGLTVDETIDQRDTCTEITAKDIVGILLEEVLLSALIVSEKGYSRIGDFNITEDFSQQFDEQVPPNYIKDFDRINVSHNPSATNQDLNLNSGENFDHSVSLLTARENLEFILDSFVKKEEKVKNLNECKVISQEILADNELQIQNGQIHLEKNKSSDASKRFLEPARHEYFKKEDIIKDEKIEIEYFNDGKINKIYVPLTNAPSKGAAEFSLPAFHASKNEEEPVGSFGANLGEDRGSKQTEDGFDGKKGTERPFKPFTTEELRQVWENGNSSSIVGRWDGDMSTQSEEVVRLMEELSAVQVYPDAPADPNRPRACAFDEEDVKRMIKEIEEINFNQSHLASEDFDLAYHPDGQGDADLESKSFNAKDNLEKTPKNPEESFANSEPESKSFNKSRNSSKKSLRDLKEIEKLSSSFATEEKEKPGRNFEFLTESEVHTQDTDVEEYLTESELSSGSLSAANPLPRTCYEESSSSTICRRHINASLKTSVDTVSLDSKISKDELYVQYELNANNWLANLEGEKDKSEEDVDGDAAGAVGVQPSASYTVPKEEEEREENRSPGSMSFSEAIVGYQSAYKQPVICLKDFKFNSEKDRNLFPDKSDSVRGSRSVNDATHDLSSDMNLPVGVGASSLGRLQSESYDGMPTVKSFFGRKEVNSLLIDSTSCPKKKESTSFSENNIGTFHGKSDVNIEKREDNVSNKIIEEMEMPRSFGVEDAEELKGDKCEVNESCTALEEEKKRISYQGSDLKLPGCNVKGNQSDKTLESSGSDQSRAEPSTSSSPPTVSQNEDVGDDFPVRLPQTFKLHSQKMYSGVDYDPGNIGANEIILTDSEEAFIESTENVIQIIDPPVTSAYEDFNSISFSLLNEMSPVKSLNSKICQVEAESDSDVSFNSNAEVTMRANEKSFSKQIHSGMTTIGPIKSIDYDPKDLTGPDVDFGKMTRITSSRQLAKDLFGTELKSAPSVKILEEDDSDEDCSLSIEGDRVDLGSLVNRDIASLTKVQKVREVMSYHPKPDEDFEDDDTLTRPRLDLKDVESMTDERYKVPDVSIPLLSFEVETNTQEPDKDFVQNMRLVLSGNCFHGTPYLDDDIEERTIEIDTKNSTIESDAIKLPDSLENLTKAQSFSARQQKLEENSVLDAAQDQTERELGPEDQERGTEGVDSDFQCGGGSGQHKYGTLGTVFKRASNKFIRKDGDLFVRSSKSLPRDTTKLTATDSIKSILDECHSSASNVLKKSRSLLKNTHSIFKTISQNRFNTHDSSGALDKQKPSPSESEIGNVERKLSSFLRKEDFSRAKILVKSKVEKTFKNFDGATPRSEPEMASEKKDLRVVIRNEENYRVDRMENFRKLLPKSPLVYKSQFVKSQISVPENSEHAAICRGSGAERDFAEPCSEVSETDEKTERISEEPVSAQPADSKEKIETPLEKKLCEGITWVNQQQKLHAVECEPEQPGFIVMETVRGLPVTDFETSLCELKKPNEKPPAEVEKPPCERGKSSAPEPAALPRPPSGQSLPYQLLISTAGNADVEALNFTGMTVVSDEPSPRLFDKGEIKEKVKFREKKSKTKNKKLSARIRSFWCSAFGRAKTPPAKTNPS